MRARSWPPRTTSAPWPLSIAPWVGPDYTVLGTDGFGRSEARKELRRFFEVDAENIALAASDRLAREGQVPAGTNCPQAIKTPSGSTRRNPSPIHRVCE